MPSPFKLTQIYQALTAKNPLLKRKLKLGTEDIPIPPKRQDVLDTEVINRFTKANPRVDTTEFTPFLKQSDVKKPNEAMVQGVVSQPVRTLDPEKDSFKKISNVLGAYKKYRRGEKNPKLNFNQFFELYSTENFAEGGRAGYEDGGMLVQPSDDGSRPGYKGVKDYSEDIQKRIKDYGIQKYNKLNNQQKYAVRTARTSTTPYSFKFGKNKFDATVTGLTKKGANNLQELLNVINEKDLTPQKWFGKTSKASGNKAKGGLDLLARDVIKYLKGEEVKGINKTIFDTIDIKTLIGDKADIVSKIDGISFRQAAGTAASAVSQVEASFDAVKLVNKEFMLDPDISIDELAERLYGKGASNSVRALQDTQADIAKYIDVLKTGTRANVQIPDFKYPSAKKAFEILDSIEDRSSSFGFQEGVIRELKFNVRDNLLNFKKGSTLSLRRMLSEVIANSDFAGNVIDESVGLSASYDKLPGYTEATQILPNELNQKKAAEIDKPFNKLINKVYNGTATPKEIKEYNASARKFMKETKVDVPIIRSTITGDNIKNPSKFIRNLSSFSEEAQKNILELAKNKNIVIETGAKPLALKEGKATMETATDFFNNNKTAMKKVMAFCPAGTAKVTKAGGGRVPYADGPVCTPEEAARGINEEIDKIKKGNASAGEKSRTLNKLKNLGSVGMRGLVKAGLVSEVLFEAALGFDKVVSEGQSPMQAFRQSYLTAPLRALGAMKSFEEGEREEILKTARDKGKVSRVLDLQNLVGDKNKLANRIENLKSNLSKVKSIDGNTFMAEKNISDAKAELQDMRRSGELTGAEQLFSTKPQDLNIKDQFLMDAYNNAIEKRKNIAAEKGSIAQSVAADRNRLRDRMNAEGILTTQDAKNEMQNIGNYYGQGFTPYGINKLYEDAGMQNPGFGIEKVGPRTGKYNEKKGLQEYLDSMRMQQIADAGGVANMASGGIASLTKTVAPESGPTPQGLPYVYNNVKKI